jgi:hypothetical protein
MVVLIVVEKIEVPFWERKVDRYCVESRAEIQIQRVPT